MRAISLKIWKIKEAMIIELARMGVAESTAIKTMRNKDPIVAQGQTNDLVIGHASTKLPSYGRAKYDNAQSNSHAHCI